MTVFRFIRDDPELATLHEAGEGLIYNDYYGARTLGAKGNLLHAARCSGVRMSNTKYRKVFFGLLTDALAWLSEHRGVEGTGWKRCGKCHAEVEGRLPSDNTRLRTTSPSTENMATTDPVPFTEGRVEKLLVPWLEAQGFTVQMRVRVPNGIIDLVARKSVDEWVIEAKGEDRGGYNTAEMNFRIGISQICSRMAEGQGKIFCLAIPMTPHFKRVLVKHMSFVVFERVGLWLLVVESNGEVRALSPDAVQQYVDQL